MTGRRLLRRVSSDPRRLMVRPPTKDPARHRRGLIGNVSEGMSCDDVVEAYWPKDLFEQGIGWVFIARIKGGGRKAVVSVFLVDVLCRGVKQAHHEVCDPEFYRRRIRDHYLSEFEMERIEPGRALALVEQAVRYAMDLGLAPDAGYEKASRIFRQIPATSSSERFVFGRDGKPFYRSGPRETESDARKVVEQLARRCGVGNFHYIVALDDPSALK